MIDSDYIAKALAVLSSGGAELAPALSSDTCSEIEHAFGGEMPPELRMLLSVAVPRGGSWVDWHRPAEELAAEAWAWVLQAFAFDIRENGYWTPLFGERPENVEDAVVQAERVVSSWPPLMPIYSHRFMPTRPGGSGNPVLSVWQAGDTICYGKNFVDYFAREFRVPPPTSAGAVRRPVPFWDEAFAL